MQFREIAIAKMKKFSPRHRFIGETSPMNQDAIVLKFVRDNEPAVFVVASGLEVLQNNAPSQAESLATARVKAALKLEQ